MPELCFIAYRSRLVFAERAKGLLNQGWQIYGSEITQDENHWLFQACFEKGALTHA